VASGGQQHPQGFAVAAAARQRLVLVAKGLPSRTDRIDRIGLGAGTTGGALGRATSTTRSPWVCRNAVSPAP
jgi:hypothetical protein